jgi:small subunit ribosomal protein S1
MSDPNNLELKPEQKLPESAPIGEPDSASVSEPEESFRDIFSEYEKSHARKPEAGAQSREGTVIAVTADSFILDIGFKSEGLLPQPEMHGAPVKLGDKLKVTVKGRDPEGYYQLTRGKVARVTDWASLEKAFAERATIVGTVTGVIKGGLSVDVGVRAIRHARHGRNAETR